MLKQTLRKLTQKLFHRRFQSSQLLCLSCQVYTHRRHTKVFNSLNKQATAVQLIWMIFEVFPSLSFPKSSLDYRPKPVTRHQKFFSANSPGELKAIKSASFIRSPSLFSSVLTAEAGQRRALIVKGFVCRTDLKECDRKSGVERWKRRVEKSIKGKSMRMSNYIPITHFFNLMLRLQLTIHISQSKLCFFLPFHDAAFFFCYAHKWFGKSLQSFDWKLRFLHDGIHDTTWQCKQSSKAVLTFFRRCLTSALPLTYT